METGADFRLPLEALSLKAAPSKGEALKADSPRKGRPLKDPKAHPPEGKGGGFEAWSPAKPRSPKAGSRRGSPRRPDADPLEWRGPRRSGGNLEARSPRSRSLEGPGEALKAGPLEGGKPSKTRRPVPLKASPSKTGGTPRRLMLPITPVFGTIGSMGGARSSALSPSRRAGFQCRAARPCRLDPAQIVARRTSGQFGGALAGHGVALGPTGPPLLEEEIQEAARSPISEPIEGSATEAFGRRASASAVRLTPSHWDFSPEPLAQRPRGL